MAYFIILAILPTCFGLSAAKKETCDLHAAIGIRLTLPFVYEKLANTDKLVWLHNYTVVYQQDKGKVSVGKPDDITASGSLVLTNPKFTSAGVYQAQVYNASGAVMKPYRCFLCVMEKVPKPTLTYHCDQKSVHFSCYTVKAQDLHYSWTMDEKILTGEGRSTLTVALSKLKSKNSLTCSVSNLVSNEISDIVFPVCASQPPSPQNQLCFQPKTVMVMVAGASGVVIVLLIVIITLYCHWGRNKSPKHREKEQPRMLSLTQREPEADYETMHVPECSPEPSPKPSPGADRPKTVDEPGAAGGSLQAARPTEEQDPSPVPKPRTKRPNTPDI